MYMNFKVRNKSISAKTTSAEMLYIERFITENPPNIN
jgi:hypothetical protein